jgi:hypothetical protein
MLAQIVGFSAEKGLGVVQIATADQDTLQYRSSGSAIKDGLLEVREVSQVGSVNHLFVLNRSDFLVFLMDGDVLMGAKQNRVVNTSVLLAPHSKTEVPVSCVEHGRWSPGAGRFQGADFSAPASLRAEKARQVRASLKDKRGHMADQGEIWNSVEKLHVKFMISSATGSLSDVYEQEGVEDFAAKFAPGEHANGVALFTGGEILSIDLFNCREVFREYFPKILRGAGADLPVGEGTQKSLTQEEASFRALDFLDQFEQLDLEEFPGVGVGVEKRFDRAPFAGFELRHQNVMVHLTALRQQRKK